EANPWWQVNLQGNYALSEIVVYNRPDAWGARDRTLSALISSNGREWQTIYRHNGSDFVTLRIPAGGRSARFVRVQLNANEFMNLAEVEVYGIPAGTTSAGQVSTPGFTTNLALGKPAAQSSTYSGEYPASKGV